MSEDISEYPTECNSESFLERFNIDTGADDQPKYIVSLDTHNDDSQTDVSIRKPDQEAPSPSTTTTPVPPAYIPYMHVTTPKSRPRGTYKPLNEIVETRIRTYQGSDSHSKVSALHEHFPQFKRCHIDRCFTRNLMDYNNTYAELFKIVKKQQEERSRFKLVVEPKDGKSRTARVIPNIKSPDLINMPSPRGRPSRQVSAKFYRRVIVGKDGTVTAADETEKNFVKQVDLTKSSTHRTRRNVPRQISFPGLPSNDFNLNEVDPTASQLEADKSEDLNRAVSEAVKAIKDAADPSTSVAPVVQDVQDEVKPGNKFFKNKRVSDAEGKKRDYVAKELQATGRATTRASTNAVTKLEPVDDDGQGEGDTSTTDNGAADFMAGVGVAQNKRVPRRSGVGRRRGTPVKHRQHDDPMHEPEPVVEVDEVDEFGLRRDERRALLAFFNESPMEELTLMSGCSQKTAEVIQNLRPFNTTVDLKLRLDATRYLSTSLIDACKELMQARAAFVTMLRNCEEISTRVNGRIGGLISNDSIDLPSDGGELSRGSKKTGFLREQPVILHPLRQLKPYQLVGLNWLRILHEEHVNGILADEMGLGKTVQAIAFLAYLYEQGERGPHLIMCPSSTIDNWQRELQTWCSQLKVLVYQGPSDVRKSMRLKIYETQQSETGPDFNVLLTSYTTATSTLEDRALMKRVDFKYGIFDEAHMLKNVTTQRYKTVSSFQIERRILLTGTPLQNNLLELISLLVFVMPDLFSSGGDHLKRMFQLMSKQQPAVTAAANEEKKIDAEAGDGSETPKDDAQEECGKSVTSRSHFERERVEQAKRLLEPFCLRRLKSQVLRQLPPKSEETIRVPFTETQRAAYANLVHEFRNAQGASAADMASDMGEDEDPIMITRKSSFLLSNKGGLGENGAAKRQKLTGGVDESLDRQGGPERLSPLNMLMQLRKAANHELLLPGIAYSDETLRELSVILHKDPSHKDADPNLVLEDLCILNDHQIHKVCRLYDVLNPFALPPESLVLGSGKVKWLDENLTRLIKEEGHRILIFSQFVIVLDILGEYLINKGHKFLRMDGSTPVTDRQTLVDTFNNDETYEIFLLSTKAGGLGISLTGADVVILHDLDFNPYNDRQAMDRCHRVGQTKPVKVIRLIAEGSVEESIWKAGEEKLRLEEDVTDFETRATGASPHSVGTPQLISIDGVADAPSSESGTVPPAEVAGVKRLAATAAATTPVPTASGKRLLQGEVFKFLSDALSYGGTAGMTPRPSH